MTIPHLDQEALSAALDDEGSAQDKAHLAGCSQCQAGVTTLGAVVRAVAAPVLPRPATDVTAAVDRALAAAEEGGTRAGASRPEVARAVVADSHERAAAGPGTPGRWPSPEIEAGSRRSRGDRTTSRRWAVTAAGLAAAVVVAAAVVGMMKGAGGSAGHTTSALAPAAGRVDTASTASAGSTDLGDQSDSVALAGVVRGLLAVSDAPAHQAAPAAGATAGPAATGPGSPASAPPCADEGRMAAGLGSAGSAPASVVRTVRWRGQPAVVLVYRGAAGPVGVVMRIGDCARLALLPL